MIAFDLDINKVRDFEDGFILKFKKIEGNLMSYRDICCFILMELRSEL